MTNEPRSTSLRQVIIDAAASVSAWYRPSSLLTLLVAALTLLLVLTAVVASYFGIDVVASLFYVVIDTHCLGDDPAWSGVGLHCFGDYYQVVSFVFRPNPWDVGSNYPASGMLPQAAFGFVGWLLDAPRVGLALYLLLAAAALITPAVWATRKASPTVRVLAIGLFGIASIPALAVLDRGNAVAFVVPALLAFFIGLRRGNVIMVAIAIVAATLIKPQFVILLIALFALRRWKVMFVTVGAIGIASLIPYLFWPAQFPSTIWQSILNALRFGRSHTLVVDYPPNVSIGKGLYEIDHLGRLVLGLPVNEWLAEWGGVIGMAVAAAFVVAVWVLGKRIPPLVAGIVLAACASLFPGTSYTYYLVFAIAVAAVLLRDPAEPVSGEFGRGALDAPERGLVGFATGAIAVATALSLTRILLPVRLDVHVDGQPERDDILLVLAAVVPVAWTVAILAALIGWARRGRADGAPNDLRRPVDAAA